MATEKQVADITSASRVIVETEIGALVTNPSKWGSLNFEAARADLDVLFGMAHELINLPVKIIPDPIANQILSHLNQAQAAVAQIRSFAIETAGQPVQIRDQIVAGVKDAANNLLTSTSAWIPFLAYQKGDVQKNIESMARAAKQIDGVLEGAKDSARVKSGELQTIIDAAREASAVAGVGVFTQDFSTQADDLQREAATWLNYTFWGAIISLAASIASMWWHMDSDHPAIIAQFITSKIVGLAVLITGTVWCGRIYKATMHQAVTNRHRAHALKTFQAFTQAASDEPTKNAVLLETTRSIFAVGPSGYLDTSEPASDPGTKVLEIIKGATAKS